MQQRTGASSEIKTGAFTTQGGYFLKRILFTFDFVLCYWKLLSVVARATEGFSTVDGDTLLWRQSLEIVTALCWAQRTKKKTRTRVPRCAAARASASTVLFMWWVSLTLSPDFGRVSSCRCGSSGFPYGSSKSLFSSALHGCTAKSDDEQRLPHSTGTLAQPRRTRRTQHESKRVSGKRAARGPKKKPQHPSRDLSWFFDKSVMGRRWTMSFGTTLDYA